MKLPRCPKTKGKKEEGEGVRRTKTDGTKELSRKSCLTLKCRICGGTDHNAKTCSHKKETTKKVEQNMNKCSLCPGLGHNRRLCQIKVPSNPPHHQSQKNPETQRTQESSVMNVSIPVIKEASSSRALKKRKRTLEHSKK